MIKLHEHSIIVVKDTFSDYPNRYLVYDDKRWDCLLFPNFKGGQDNLEHVKNHLSSSLKIDKSSILLTYVAQEIHEKFSESAKENRVYNHSFYLAKVKNFPEHMKPDSFEIDGVSYYWKTIMDLEQDKNVQKKNMDILSYIKKLF